MSVAAIKIVREEIERRKSNQPDIHCAHDMLDTLEARIVDRIKKELVEIPEPTIQEKYSNLEDSEFPDCFFCKETAVYEGWTGDGHVIRVFACTDHKDRLKGSEKS